MTTNTTGTTETTATKRVTDISSTVTLQLIVENTETAATYYQRTFGASIFRSAIIAGAANKPGALTEAANGTEEALATKTIVIGNTAINLVSKKTAAQIAGVKEKTAGDVGGLPVILTVQVANIQTIVDQATANNAKVVQGTTTTAQGDKVAYIRGQEGYLWCLTQGMAVNTAGGVGFETAVAATV